EERTTYHGEIEERKTAILAEIAGQGKLTEELRAKIQAATVKSALEDLYAPFRPKRRTRAAIARERGLEPLATRILEQPSAGSPEALARPFVDPAKGVPDVKAALAGARDIVAELLADRPDIRGFVRGAFAKTGVLTGAADAAKTKAPTKFETYYDFKERAANVPSHRFLAIQRGEAEGILRAKIAIDEERTAAEVARLAPVRKGTPFAAELTSAAE